MTPFRYLLDTNVVSEMMKPAPDPRVQRCLDAVAADGLGLSSITVWEILNGIGHLDPGRRRDTLERQFRGLLDDYFADRILDWSADDAAQCARVMETKRRRGEPLDDHLPDAMLAAVAATRGLVVLTRNEREFHNTGAAFANPWNAAV